MKNAKIRVQKVCISPMRIPSIHFHSISYVNTASTFESGIWSIYIKCVEVSVMSANNLTENEFKIASSLRHT